MTQMNLMKKLILKICVNLDEPGTSDSEKD